jgi:hypothetical protein
MKEKFPNNNDRQHNEENMENPDEISEELKLELSNFFTNELVNGKERLQNFTSVGANESTSPYINLSIFSGALQGLARHSRVPKEMRIRLQLIEPSLWITDNKDLDFLLYQRSIDVALEILSELLTPEAISGLQKHVEKIFLPPAEHVATKK